MPRPRMHADEVPTSPELLRDLLADQFPDWADGPIRLVPSWGTDHDIYRVGEELSVRMPRIGWATAQAAKEGEWLPRLGPHLPLMVPIQLAMGRPGHGYPFDWSVYAWLDGASALDARLDAETAAVDLARFVRALRAIDTDGAFPRPRSARGAPLTELDEQVRRSILASGTRIDQDVATRIWDEALAVGPADQETWLHGDLMPGNLIVVRGGLSAVIDWGGLNVGDPAADLQPAWNLFSGASRATYRAELGVDDASWVRGRGWALYQAVSAIPYYWDTNPGMITQVTHTLRELIAEWSSAA